MTMSGEICDVNSLTAAHKTLPFGTVLRVTNKYNGKSVDVRVNDRGSHTDHRVLVLSKEAFQRVEELPMGIFQCTYREI